MTAPLRMSFDVARGAGATRVEIEHRDWERLGPDSPDGQAWRDRNQAGWQSLVPYFLTAIDRGDR